MVWVRLDDHLHSHPKIRHAWHVCPPSLGLHLVGLSYAGDHLTDGLIDPEFVRQWLPARAQRERAVAALEDARLWTPADGRWQIHDYLDYNESRESIEARRRVDAARKRPAGRRVSS